MQQSIFILWSMGLSGGYLISSRQDCIISSNSGFSSFIDANCCTWERTGSRTSLTGRRQRIDCETITESTLNHSVVPARLMTYGLSGTLRNMRTEVAVLNSKRFVLPYLANQI